MNKTSVDVHKWLMNGFDDQKISPSEFSIKKFEVVREQFSGGELPDDFKGECFATVDGYRAGKIHTNQLRDMTKLLRDNLQVLPTDPTLNRIWMKPSGTLNHLMVATNPATKILANDKMLTRLLASGKLVCGKKLDLRFTPSAMFSLKEETCEKCQKAYLGLMNETH